MGQQLEGGLRSRTPESIGYQVAGHLVYYLLVRWLLVEAAVAAGVSPLRLSVTAALREIDGLWGAGVVGSTAWVQRVLRPRLRGALAGQVVSERPGRQYPRDKRRRRAKKRASQEKRRRGPKAKKPRTVFGEGWELRWRTTARFVRAQS